MSARLKTNKGMIDTNNTRNKSVSRERLIEECVWLETSKESAESALGWHILHISKNNLLTILQSYFSRSYRSDTTFSVTPRNWEHHSGTRLKDPETIIPLTPSIIFPSSLKRVKPFLLKNPGWIRVVKIQRKKLLKMPHIINNSKEYQPVRVMCFKYTNPNAT